MKQISLVNGSRSFTWYDNSGGTILREYEGFEFPQSIPLFENVPGKQGSYYAGSKFGSRRLAWVGDLLGENRYQLRRDMLAPASPGSLKTLKFTTFDDILLQCEVEIISVRNPYTGMIHTFSFEAIAPDYRFFSQTLNELSTSPTTASGGIALPTSLPIDFSNVVGVPKLEVDNDGDEATPPVFTVHGPGTNFIIQNTTTGEILNLNTTLSSSEEVVIDVLNRTAYQGNTNIYSLISGTFWSLAGGENVIHFNAQSGSGANTLLTVAYRNAYKGI